MKVTLFYDMSSGGSQKLEHHKIIIQDSEEKAIEKFSELFHRDPTNTTCDCCGQDYFISEYSSLKDALEQYSDAYVVPLTPLQELL